MAPKTSTTSAKTPDARASSPAASAAAHTAAAGLPPIGSATGMVVGAHESGLRDCYRRVASAIAVGRPLEAADAPAGRMTATGNPCGRTPELQVVRGVGVIDVAGPLAKGADLYNWFFGTLTYGQLAEQCEQARQDVRVQAVLLRIDSPGGTVAGVSDLVDAVDRLRSAGKPVVAGVSDLCASCAYQVASHADRLFLDRDGWVGSIGVFVVIDDFSQMYQNAGWNVRVFASSNDPFKGMGAPGTETTDAQAAEYQRVVDELGTEMIASVYRGRPALRTNASLPLPDGRCYLGENAVALGLADAVAPWPDVLAAMLDGDLKGERLASGGRRSPDAAS